MEGIQKKAQRNSWVELLRILCMFFIIVAHYAGHSGFVFDRTLSTGKLVVQTVTFGGSIGVTCFMLITGYYNCERNFRLKSLIKLLAEVWFYTFSIALLLSVTRLNSLQGGGISIKELLLPNLTELYWFPAVYTMIYLLSPFYNMLIRAMNQRQHFSLIAMLLFVWSVLYMLSYEVFSESSTAWFSLIYFIGAYIRRYPLKQVPVRRHFLRALVLFAPAVLSLVAINAVYAFTDWQGPNVIMYMDFYSLFTVFGSVELLLGFLYMKPWNSKFVNQIASTCFGVYLIHEHPMVRHLLWRDLVDGVRFYHSPWLIPYMLGCAAMIFVVCAIVDLIRQRTVERAFFYLMDRKGDGESRFQAMTSRLVDGLLRRIHG